LGPVFFYILGSTIDSNYINSLFAIMAVTIADYIYIVLSLIGIGKLLQEDKIKTAFGIVSSIILILFGFIILFKELVFIHDVTQFGSIVWTPLNSFTSCFVLTISSPLTIVFWGSIFSAKAIEKNYKKKQLILFGIGTGSSTFLFLSLTMMILSLLKSNIPNILVLILNCVVGIVLVYYGITRTIKIIKNKES
ncbi:MAG: LysE family translocator, partial [Desulfobacteraceae bacterium]|nr:LysE family translocator [Desulfobacteraceae bacterium]